MAGTSVSSGAENQAAAAAYVAVRMLLERPLYWVAPSDDIPVAVAGEVGGMGDDLEIDFGSRRPPLGVQCKRSLAGPAALRAAIEEMSARRAPAHTASEVVLMVGPGSSPEIRDVFATDVRNFRQGRTDGLRPITKGVLDNVHGAADMLSRLYVIALDVDRESDTGAQFAIDGLRQAIQESDRAGDVWGLLIRNALKLGQKGRWTREHVVALLRSHGLTLRPIGADAAWLEHIEFAQKLNDKWRHRTAAGVLDHLALEIDGKTVARETRRRLHTVRGTSAFGLGEFARAKVEIARAIDYAPPKVDASTPSEDRKSWCDLRATYGMLLHFSEDDDDAAHWAREVVAVDPQHVRAWAVLTESGRQEGSPLPAVADAPDYREALARTAMQRGDWQEAADSVSDLVSRGEQRPQAYNLYGQALLNVAIEMPHGPERTQLLERTDRAADDAIRILENGELDKFLAMVLFLRGRARELLGRITEAQPDYDRAAALNPAEPNILSQMVHSRVEADDRAGALALLNDESVAASPTLRVLRADLLAKQGSNPSAGTDLQKSLDELPARANRAFLGVYCRVAEISLELNRLDLAARALDAISDGGLGDDGPDAGVLRARLAVAHDDWQLAEKEFRAAAGRGSADERSLILSEFAAALGSAGQAVRAVGIFEEVGASSTSHAAFGNFVTALMKSGMFEAVANLASRAERDAINAGGATADLPKRLLDAAIDVAWRAEDHATAARLLDARIEQEGKEGNARLSSVLSAAMAHTDGGNIGRAGDLLNEVLSRPELAPEDRMRAANVLAKLGATQRAVDTAFMAVRASPTDKRMVANFIHLVLAPSLRPVGAESRSGHRTIDVDDVDGGEDPAAGHDGYVDEDIGNDGRKGVVKPDSFVGCVTQDGQQIGYFIYERPPVDARFQEYLTTDPVVADLVGKQVGSTVVRNAGTWHEQRLRIVRVVPAVVVVFRRYLRTFSAQFPDEPMLRAFKVGETPTLESLGPILAVMHAGQEADKRRLAMYEESPVPLGLLAETMGKRLVDVVRFVTSASANRRLWVDGSPYTEYNDGLQAALSASSVVLTRPALLFLNLLGLWSDFAGRYRLVAPKAMMEEWQQELEELSRMAKAGQTFLREAEGRPVVDVVPIGAADAALEESRSLFERVRSAATMMPRPASALNPEDDKWRELIGAPSFDAIALARAEGAAVYADDLGLRVVAAREYKTASFATAALLDAMRAEGRLAPDAFERGTIKLVEWGHDHIAIRATTIAAAFTGAGNSAGSARLVLDRLADARVTASSAAVVAAGGLALIAKATIVIASIEEAAALTAEALVRHRDPAVVVPLYLAAVRKLFALSPNDLRRIAEATSRIVNGR